MKRKCFLLLTVAIFISCVNFLSPSGKVTEEKIRLIDFIFVPPEAAPGDSVNLYAIFAGKEVNIDDIKWRISTKSLKNKYGIDTFIEVKPLDGEISQYYFSPMTSCIHLSFKIPDDCLVFSSNIKESLLSFLSADNFDSITTEEILSFFENIPKNPELINVLTSDSLYLPFVKYFPFIANLYSGKIRIFADIKDDRPHTIVSDFIVNYNNLFSNYPQLNVRKNNNPSEVLDSIIVYKINSKVFSPYNFDLDTLKQKSECTFQLIEKDTSEIVVDKGYFYYLYFYINDKRDSVYSLAEEKWIKESYSIYCYYEMDSDETKGISENELMNIVEIGKDLFLLYPPLNRKIKNFTLWIKIIDKIEEPLLNRSQGSFVWERQCRFFYREDEGN